MNTRNVVFYYGWEKGLTKTGFFSITVFNELVFKCFFFLSCKVDGFLLE